MNVSHPFRFFPRLVTVLGAGVFSFFLASSVCAQPSAFEKAKKAYEVYDYKTAIDMFSRVADDSSVDLETRRQAMLHLGRIYVGQDMKEEARSIMEDLVNTDPPSDFINPDREPPPLLEIYYTVMKEKQGDYAVQKEDPGLQTLTIMDFRNSSIYEPERYDPLAKGFPSMMINYLNGATDLKVIERQRIQWLLNELKLQKKVDIVDQSTAVKVGNLLGATAVLFGNYSVVSDDRMRLSGRLVKVETSEILLAEKVTGEPDEFFSLVRELSQNLTRAINVEVEDTELETGSETRLLDAQLAYARGLDEMEDENYQAARTQFKQALEYDSNYTLAKKRLESLQPMLASAQSDSTDTSDGEGGLRDR